MASWIATPRTPEPRTAKAPFPHESYNPPTHPGCARWERAAVLWDSPARPHGEHLQDHDVADEPRQADSDAGVPRGALHREHRCASRFVLDYMTRENLMTGGGPFVQAFTQAILKVAQ